MAENSDWRRAFARQAQADLHARTLILPHVAKGLPRCQELHFLQMACEKLVKAHLFSSKEVPGYVFSSHAVVAKHLPRILQEYYRRQRSGKVMPDYMNKQMRAIARNIELLAPAVTAGGQHVVNCEYPWSHGERVYAPADYDFTELTLTNQPGATFLLKLLPIILDDLVR